MATSMGQKIERLLQDLKDQYVKTVRAHPEHVAQLEAAVRILSFLVAGRFENGELISELIYSTSNLLVFLNDNVFKAATKYIQSIEISKERLKRWLTVLQYVEVFLEMGSRKKWGTYGAWIMITVIQVTKTVLRFYMLLSLNGGIQSSPPVLPVDRSLLKTELEEEHDPLEAAWDEEEDYSAPEKTYTLSTGRQVRTLNAAEFGMRTWTVPKSDPEALKSSIHPQRRKRATQSSTELSTKRLMAECMYVAKPVAHLMSTYIFGQFSWTPWLLACGMDLSSLSLMGEFKDLKKDEQAELKRRRLRLLYYLMRSPFYDKYTRSKLLAVFHFIAMHVPLSGLIIRPLLDYLPTWQRMYFYVWST